MKKIDIKIKVLNKDINIPEKQHETDAGWDLHSINDYTLKRKEILKIKTGLAIEIPNNYAGLILPRSGLSSKFGITLINSPGLIDPGYRGELLIPLINHSEKDYLINKGERVAQLVIIENSYVNFIETSDLGESDRNDQGFGSTDDK